MNLQTALARLGDAPVGFTSMLAAPDSTSARPVDPSQGLEEVQRVREQLEQSQRTCGSDAAYWGYAAQISFCRAAEHILLAAARVGPDNLPDVPAPEMGGVLMDLMAQQERYGRAVFDAALAMPLRPEEQPEAPPEGPRILEMGLGSAEPLGDTVPPGMQRRQVMLKSTDIKRVSNAVISRLQDMKNAGDEPALLLVGLLHAAGAVMAYEGIPVDPEAEVGKAFAPLLMGHEDGLSNLMRGQLQ